MENFLSKSLTVLVLVLISFCPLLAGFDTNNYLKREHTLVKPYQGNLLYFFMVYTHRGADVSLTNSEHPVITML